MREGPSGYCELRRRLNLGKTVARLITLRGPMSQQGPRALVVKSGMAPEVVETNRSLLLSQAGKSLGDRWTCIMLYNLADTILGAIYSDMRSSELEW